MSVYKIFILLVLNRECMERNVMTSFRTVFFTLQCELFTSCNVSNNASLVSAWTGGGGSQSNVDRPRQGEEGVPKIPKFVQTSFTDDPYLQKQLLVGVSQSRFSENLTIFTEKHLYQSLFFIKLQA